MSDKIENTNQLPSFNYLHTISIPIGMCVINQIEYNNLIKENIELKTKILQLYDNERTFRQLIETKDRTIEELKNENIELRQRLETLEKKYNILEDEHNKLKSRYNILELKHNILESKLEEMFHRDAINKFIIAIQDTNRLIGLDTMVDLQTKTELLKLKKKRINGCHYLNNNDNTALVNDKRTVLLDKINNINPEVEKVFNHKYPNLLANIKRYIVTTPTNPLQNVLDDIDEWWEE